MRYLYPKKEKQYEAKIVIFVPVNLVGRLTVCWTHGRSRTQTEGSPYRVRVGLKLTVMKNCFRLRWICYWPCLLILPLLVRKGRRKIHTVVRRMRKKTITTEATGQVYSCTSAVPGSYQVYQIVSIGLIRQWIVYSFLSTMFINSLINCQLKHLTEKKSLTLELSFSKGQVLLYSWTTLRRPSYGAKRDCKYPTLMILPDSLL